MTKRFRKVLSIVCTLALLLSCAAAGFAEEMHEEAEAYFVQSIPDTEMESPAPGENSGEQSEGFFEVEEMSADFLETDPEDEEEGEPDSDDPENEEVVSDPVTIQDAVEEEEEDTDDSEPDEEKKPEEPDTPAQTEEEQEPEDNSEGETPEEEQESKPADKPDKPEKKPEDTVILDLGGVTTINGILTRGKPFAFIAADAYSRTAVFTLTVAEENAVFVTMNDKPVTLTKEENPNPASTDVIYTFEKQLDQNRVYSITLTTEKEGYIPYTLSLTEKQEKAAEEMPETAEEPTEKEEKAEETDFGLEGEGNPDEEKNEDENTSDLDENEFPEEFAIRFDVTWDGDELHFGDVAHFIATVSGDEDVDYTIQWQWSEDNENWVTVEDEHEMQMDITVTEDNYLNYWRIKAEIVNPELVNP